MSFWDVVWLIIISFAFVAYLMALFSIFADLFRDTSMSGGLKAVWIVLLIFFPLITALVYIIVRGQGMQERSVAQQREARAQQDEYIRTVAASSSGSSGKSAAEQIADAKSLLDSGTITPDEFAALKAKALA
jgi:hypothetical protein